MPADWRLMLQTEAELSTKAVIVEQSTADSANGATRPLFMGQSSFLSFKPSFY